VNLLLDLLQEGRHYLNKLATKKLENQEFS